MIDLQIPPIDWASSIRVDGVMILYGIPPGKMPPQIHKWLRLRESHHLVIISENHEFFLKSSLDPSWHHPRLCVETDTDKSARKIALMFLDFPLFWAVNDPMKVEEGATFFKKITTFHEHVTLLAADTHDMGGKVFAQIVANLSLLPRSILGSSLRGCCTGIPAVICGSGPSLQQKRKWLSTLENQAVIIAGGSAASALSHEGICPHLCAQVDPDPPEEDFLLQNHYEVPHLYRSRFSSHLASLLHGPLLWMPGSSSLDRWIEDAFHVGEETLDGGWTSTTFAVACALVLGCDPIVLVGVELSASQCEMEERLRQQPNEVWIPIGSNCFSKKDWLMSRRWLSECAARFPNHHFFNLSQGKCPIPGIDDTQESVLKFSSVDLRGKLHAAIENGKPFPATPAELSSFLTTLQKSLQAVKRLAEQLLQLWEKAYPTSPLESGHYALFETELEREPAYAQIVEPLWSLWRESILRSNCEPFGEKIHKLLFCLRVTEGNQAWLY